MEYEKNENGGDNLEQTTAATFDHPYEFSVLKTNMAGTNEFIVIARTMTPKFLDAMKAIHYKSYTREQEVRLGGDFRKFIHSEADFYFRKWDGISFGLIERNYLGEQLKDSIYDEVEINQPISTNEFALPKGEVKTAKSSGELSKIINGAKSENLNQARQNPAATLSEKRVSELPWAVDLPKALEQAKAENKIVLLDFTGSDWCVWCTKFDDDVLAQPEFAGYAKTNLVMVRLDFPNAKPQSDSAKKANRDLQDKFKVDGFPTYVALTPDGKEIGRQVGYLKGGPQAFIAELDVAVK